MKKFAKLGMEIVILLAAVGAFGGKMESYGGFKARNYKKGADGKMYTSAGTEVLDFKTDLSTEEQMEYIEAAQMASSGYPDHRNDEFKNTSYRDGEFSQLKLQEIVDLANKKSPNSDFKVFEQRIREYDDSTGKWKYKEPEEIIYTITAKDDTRLCVRVFEKIDENGNKTIGVVYGGTDWGTTGVTPKLWVDDAADARDDAKQITHLAPTPQAYKDAATVLQAIAEIYHDTDINVYGHSEGGGEAMYSVLSTGVKNGKNEKTGEDCRIKYYGVNSAGLNGLKTNDVINDNLTKKDIADNFTLIQNSDASKTTLFHGEWCSTKAYQFGKVISIPDMGDAFGTDEDGKITENTFLCNGMNEDDSLRDSETSKGKKKGQVVVNESGKTVTVKSNLDNQHGVEETLWKMMHIVASKDKSEDRADDIEVHKSDEDPFNSQPSSSGGGQSGGVNVPKPSPGTRVRRGGGGDTKARIWP